MAPFGRKMLLLGAVAAAGAAVLLKRDKVAGLLPSRSGDSYQPPAPAPFPPQPSNYDVSGPVANTSTPIPAPDHQPEAVAVTPPADAVPAPPPVDEAAEEAAAAAEAAAIGGTPEPYVGEDRDTPADEAFRPLAEAGEGEAEGQEQAEADLEENATYRDAGMSDAERQIDDAIEEADTPWSGETPEPVVSEEPGGTESSEAAAESAEQTTFLPPAAPEQETREIPAVEPEPEAEATAEPEPEPEPEAAPEPETETAPEPAQPKNDDDDWRTWSGQAVNR